MFGVGRGSARAEDAQGKTTLSHTLPSILESTKIRVLDLMGRVGGLRNSGRGIEARKCGYRGVRGLGV